VRRRCKRKPRPATAVPSSASEAGSGVEAAGPVSWKASVSGRGVNENPSLPISSWRGGAEDVVSTPKAPAGSGAWL